MSSWGDAAELRVTQFDKTEEETRIKYPDLTYTYAYEEYYPQMAFSWADEGVKIKKKKTTIVFKCCYYQVLKAMMANLAIVVVDGRNAPYEDCFKGHYLRDVVSTVSYLVQEIDNETGKILFEKEIDTMPNIIHNLHEYEKEHEKEMTTISSKEKMKELLEVNPYFYDMIDDSLKEDEELAMNAVKGNGWNYRHLNQEFKLRKDFQLEAFVSNSSLAHWLPKELLEDYDFLLEACKRNKYCFNEIEDESIKEKINDVLALGAKKVANSQDNLPF